jgi:hypothetical protein
MPGVASHPLLTSYTSGPRKSQGISVEGSVSGFRVNHPSGLFPSSPSPSKFPDSYFLCSLLSASFSAVSSASAAFTFTSGSTPVPSQSVFE